MKLRNKTTGEICEAEAREDGIYLKANWSDEGKWFKYELDLLAGGWEYYVEPKEPYIDNEEIREIVRAWADVNDAGRLKYNSDENSLDDIYRNTITFNRGLSLEDGHSYTITELCGEEEAPEPIEPKFIDLDERIKEKGGE